MMQSVKAKHHESPGQRPMFRLDPSVHYIETSEKDVADVYRSVSEVTVAPGDLPAEPYEACVCAIKTASGEMAYVALIPAAKKEALIYTPDESISKGKAAAEIVDEALAFAKSLGFTMEKVNLNYSRALREVILRNIRIIRLQEKKTVPVEIPEIKVGVDEVPSAVKEKPQAEKGAAGQPADERGKAARLERETILSEKAKAEKRAAEQSELVRIARQKAETEKAELERFAAEKSEAERLAREQAEAARLAQKKLEEELAQRERLLKEKTDAEQLALKEAEEARLALERAEAERAEWERLLAEKEEEEKMAREAAEAGRRELEKAEAERDECKRLVAEQVEAEQKAREKAEAARLLRKQAEEELAEKERLLRDAREMENAALEEAEAARLARGKGETELAEKEKLVAERAAALKQLTQAEAAVAQAEAVAPPVPAEEEEFQWGGEFGQAAPRVTFALDRSFASIAFDSDEDVVELYQSLNTARIALEEYPSQDCEAYVCVMKKKETQRVFVALYLNDNKCTLVFCPERQPETKEECERLIHGAVNFVETVGFMMDRVDLGEKEGRAKLLEKIPVLRRKSAS